ncbi:MAG TPA: biotin--[acetyl-CoA-carboxylase] ligase [Candidatus Dormibacteraeota bacterium]|nr:biotin--[acetyl-CoA-carboxylase] ligase [Candidatus Dormibacteraeota bacterium]
MTTDFAVVQAAGRAAFPGFALRVVARTPSTQDVVRAAARAGAAAGWCCVAGEQTAGRGRQGRVWTASAGSALLCSVLLRVPAAVAGGVPLAAGVAVADAVGALGALGVGLKWPNDVLAADGGKLAGILAEVEPRGGGAIVLGVGLNLGARGTDLDSDSRANLNSLVGREVQWQEALARLLTALGNRLGQLEHGGIPATVAAWRPYAVGLGAEISADTPAGPITGIARDIADDGALLVDTGTETIRLLAGDVHLRRR